MKRILSKTILVGIVRNFTSGRMNYKKAVTINNYRNKDLLNSTEVPILSLRKNDILIEVKATSVKPIDLKIREGRLSMSIQYELPMILG